MKSSPGELYMLNLSSLSMAISGVYRAKYAFLEDRRACSKQGKHLKYHQNWNISLETHN